MKRKRTASAVFNAGAASTNPRVTMNQVLQYTFQREGLINRKPAVTTELFPLHATASTTPPLSLLARVQRFQEEHLESYLQRSRSSPLQFTLKRCMRGTLHVIDKDSFPVISEAYKHPFCSYATERISKCGISSSELSLMSKFISEQLQEHGPANAVSITKLVKEKGKASIKVKNYELGTGKNPLVRSNVGIALDVLYSQSEIHYGLDTSDSSWSSSRRLYGMATMHAPDSDLYPSPTRIAEATAIHDLAAWYFQRYGPASLQDFVWWSAKKITVCRPVVNDLISHNYLTTVEVATMPQQLYMWTPYLSDLVNTVDEMPNFVRFLPYEDALIKAYKETRYRYMYSSNTADETVGDDEAMNKFVISGGEAAPTVWVDGQIIGRWSWNSSHKKSADAGAPVSIITPTRLTAKVKKRLESELGILCDMLQCDVGDVEYTTNARAGSWRK